jgi:hypothetical protein
MSRTIDTRNLLLVIRNGEIKLRLPKWEQRPDGTLWVTGSPLLDKDAAGAPPLEELKRLTNEKRYSEIPAACFLKRGESPTGALVLTEAEWEAHPSNTAAAAAEAAFQARYAAQIKEARRTGKPVVIETWMTDRCMNGNGDDCSFDHATQVMLPTGKLKVTYACCH